MKLSQYIILLFFPLSITLHIFSQNCDPYFPMREGAEFEISNYDNKDNFNGKAIHKVISKTTTGDDMQCKIHMESYDKKNKLVTSNDYKVYCKNGNFEFDMKMLLDNDKLSNIQKVSGKIDIDIVADFIEIPNQPIVGESLEDGKMIINIESSGVNIGTSGKIMTMKVNIFNRKVEAFEKITTTTGTFDCLKISFDTETKYILKVTGSVIEWYCKNVGMVKSESYNKKGKLIGYSILTKIN